MKTCCKCKKEKSPKKFYNQSDRKTGSSYCRICFNEYCMTRWKQKKEDAIAYKGGKCVDCSRKLDTENPAYLFDFHHLDPSTKECSWIKMRLMGDAKMKRELDKCICLCVICHRHREYRANW